MEHIDKWHATSRSVHDAFAGRASQLHHIGEDAWVASNNSSTFTTFTFGKAGTDELVDIADPLLLILFELAAE